MQAYLDSLVDAKGNPKPSGMKMQRVNLAIMLIVNESGDRMFDESHRPEIAQWPFDVLKQIEKEAQELCQVPKQEDLEKNSEALQGDDSH